METCFSLKCNVCKIFIGFLLLQVFTAYFNLLGMLNPRHDSSKEKTSRALPVYILKEELMNGTNIFTSITVPKRILLWTPFFSKGESLADFYLGNMGGSSQEQICRYNCHFTVNKEHLNSSDAVLFHGRDITTTINSTEGNKTVAHPANIPLTRLSKQYWIFYLLESPAYTWVDLNAFRDFFNLTMTYRADSDIYMPYCRLINAPSGESLVQALRQKTRMVAWVVSNCETKSKRELIVAELRKYFQVDAFGGCGYDLCDPRDAFQRSCYRQIGAYYKFYLAFENSLCEDYVTEKFFNALDAGMVPVVYGGADYTRHAPEGSYINVNSFTSIKDLADYLLMLDKNPSEYLKYFEWRKRFKVDNIPTWPRAWCNLCERLTKGSLPENKVITDLKSWWFNKNGCKNPLFLS